ncbi:MAG: efflux RND transporter permease subunit [Candidatus Cloacimonetes bacterium]|nr:efflux RND transporter permease subunit [Candidatus Cloacimonadota bacterium]
MKLPEFSVNRRVTVIMLTILVIILGIVAFTQLGLEMLPDLDYPTISIVTTYPGASSEDVEEMITKTLERSIAGAKGVKNVKSESMEGISLIMVEFVWGTNLDFAAQDLRDAIEWSLDYLPTSAKRPMVMKFNLSQMPILYYGITGMENAFELRKLIEDEIEPKLKHLDGVAAIEVWGGEQAEKQVIIDKVKLEQNNISIDELVAILSTQNLNKTAGYIEKRQDEFLLRIIGEYKSIKEIENTPISITKAGNVIYIKDIAKVVDGFKEKRYYLRTNGKPTVILFASKESGANTVTVSERIKKELEIIKKELPQAIQFAEVFDQGHIVSRVTTRTGSDLMFGGLLAILIMFLFLRNWRPTSIISLAIPISVIATFIPIYLAKYSLNIMTLGGLALGVGMLVDNAIIVIENIYRHLEMGEGKIPSAKIGASEVGMAITASTLTTIAVFLPMIFAGGFTGQLVRGLALTVAFALCASLFVALTIVPMIASIIFKKRKSGKEYQEATGKMFIGIRNKYLKLLNLSLRHRAKTLIMMGIIFIIAIALIPLIGTEFIPKTDMPMQTLNIKTPIGTSLEETNTFVSQIEEIVGNIKEVKYVMGMVGPMTEGGAAADPTNPQSTNEAQVFFRLFDKEERERSSEEIVEEVRSKIPKLEGVELTFVDMSGQMMGGTESPISIKLFGKDLPVLKSIGEEIENKIVNIQGVCDVDNSYKQGKPELHIHIDRDKAFRYGLTILQVASVVKTATFGTVAGVFREAGDEIDILVRLDEESRNSLQDVENLSITSPLGFTIPLKQVATFEMGEGPIKISREHQTRKVTISANVVRKEYKLFGLIKMTKRDIGSTVKEIQTSIKDIKDNLSIGYFIEFGGAYEDMKETFKTLFYALLLAALLVYVILSSLFESFKQPLVIMFTLPLAYVGVIFILFITGSTLSAISFVGIIVLSGIVVNDGIVLIDHANQLRRKGLEPQKAIIQAGSDRMRPVLITSITTIGGMFPMAISTGQGSAMRAPMAIAVIGGLITATFFTLLIIPTIYSIVERISYKKKKEL